MCTAARRSYRTWTIGSAGTATTAVCSVSITISPDASGSGAFRCGGGAPPPPAVQTAMQAKARAAKVGGEHGRPYHKHQMLHHRERLLERVWPVTTVEAGTKGSPRKVCNAVRHNGARGTPLLQAVLGQEVDVLEPRVEHDKHEGVKVEQSHFRVVVRDQLGTQPVERMKVQEKVIGQTDKGGQREQDGGRAMAPHLDGTCGIRAWAAMAQGQDGVQQTQAEVPGTMKVGVKSQKQGVAAKVDRCRQRGAARTLKDYELDIHGVKEVKRGDGVDNEPQQAQGTWGRGLRVGRDRGCGGAAARRGTSNAGGRGCGGRRHRRRGRRHA